MRVVNSFPRRVRRIENCWIPLPDGCRLAARIWLPEDATDRPVPAIIEYIPYRKRDGTRERDEPMHHYFAGHGYAAVRIDLRGSGESDGVLLDEYLQQEHRDCIDAIRWIASRPWCTGAVGMMGKSWGGTNSLQVAALRPPELKAILTVCSSVDRYADDAHFMGGCLLTENLAWGSVLFTINAQPPDPALVGDRWRDMWFERLEHDSPFPAVWLRHQRRDGFWKHGSVCEDYSQIACPVYAVSGWADAYTNTVPRLLEKLRVPRKGLVGPWAHLYPHNGVPGPAMGFLQEALRWWNHWLKGIDTGIMEEPMYRVWMEESVPPKAFYEERPGRWIAESSWPSDRIEAKLYFVNLLRLGEDPDTEHRLEYLTPQTVGLNSGNWCAFGVKGEMPTDQREDDGKSLIFDSEALAEPIEILGAPLVKLALAVDQPSAFVAVRLNDVAPDGSSTRVTYGLLNLTHYRSQEQLEPLKPGKRYNVQIELNHIAHAFPAGHRIRLAISTSYWPVVWPSPRPVTLTLFTGASYVELPVRPPREEDDSLRPFEEPESAPPLESVNIQPAGFQRTITRDLLTDEWVYTACTGQRECGATALSRVDEIDLVTGESFAETFRLIEGDPTSATAEVVQQIVSSRGEWSIRVETLARLSATVDTFRVEAKLEAFEGDTRVFSRSWELGVPRDLV